jgi:2-polyprenyl-6-methoxyphenol hydroxylase-like FAD-dependent oxidoreductase
MKNNKPKILVIGAGPTGLTLACSLRKFGVPCRIIDKNSSISNLSKAIGMSAASLHTFQKIGVSEALLNEGLKIPNIYVHWNHQRLMHINYKYLESSPYQFVLNIHQPRTEYHLIELLEKLGGYVERQVVLNDIQLEKRNIAVTLQHANGQIEKNSYEYIIGCDGANSSVRNLMNIPFTGRNYGPFFVYADVNIQGNPSSQRIDYYASETGLLIVIPTPNQIYRVVGLIYDQLPEGQRPQPTLADMQKYVDKHGPGDIVLKNPLQLGSVPLYHRIAATNQVGRVFLAGDAFHLFSPIGGQGMNTGIQDAYNLAWKLAYKIKGFGKTTLLDSYKEERLRTAQELTSSIDAITQLIMGKQRDTGGLLEKLLPVFANRFTIRKQLPSQFSGFNLNYRQSSIVKDSLKSDLVQAGDRIPCIRFEKTTHLLVIHTQDNEKTILIRNLVNELNHFNDAFIKFHLIECLQTQDNFSTDIIRKLQLNLDSICLIRPDNYIEYRGSLTNIQAFKNHLNRVYSFSPEKNYDQ